MGAGIQSTTISLLAKHGEIPPIDHAIFADTGAEPKNTYRHLAHLETILPFPVHHVASGNLTEEIMSAMATGKTRINGRPPFFVTSGGMIFRQCTVEYKIKPILRKVRELAGIAPRSRGPKEVVVEQLIGISTDEASRMKDSNFRWVKHYFPLIELNMSRTDCITWLTKNGYATPPKSACTYCPMHSKAHWIDMKKNDPESFEEAARVDDAIRKGVGIKPGTDTEWFVHRSRKPLREAVQDTQVVAESNQFINECSGHCGV